MKFIMMNKKGRVKKICFEDVEGFLYHDTKYQMPYSITLLLAIAKNVCTNCRY